VGEERVEDPKYFYKQYKAQLGAVLTKDGTIQKRPLPQEQAQEYLTELVREELEHVKSAKETLDLQDKVKMIAENMELSIDSYESQFRATLYRLQNVG